MLKSLYIANPEINNYKNIVIFGAGRSGVQLLIELTQLGIRVDCFCDSNKEKWGEVVMGKKVISVGELKSIQKDTAVLVGRAYTLEICNQLEKEDIQNIFMPFMKDGIIL